MPTPEDVKLAQLCIWKEARGEGTPGMTVVGCVIRNRAVRHGLSWSQVIMKKWAFSSMTDPHDPQLHRGAPDSSDPEYAAYLEAGRIAQSLAHPATPDMTCGATLYYDGSIGFPPTWNRAAVIPAGIVGRLHLWREA